MTVYLFKSREEAIKANLEAADQYMATEEWEAAADCLTTADKYRSGENDDVLENPLG
jgi:tripartite-type tricarboxylate transporter receptor subunit TctC